MIAALLPTYLPTSSSCGGGGGGGKPEFPHLGEGTDQRARQYFYDKAPRSSFAFSGRMNESINHTIHSFIDSLSRLSWVLMVLNSDDITDALTLLYGLVV